MFLFNIDSDSHFTIQILYALIGMNCVLNLNILLGREKDRRKLIIEGKHFSILRN